MYGSSCCLFVRDAIADVYLGAKAVLWGKTRKRWDPHEDRLFRQARPARPANLLRARRQAAQRRAARARRAPAGGGEERRPSGPGAPGARRGAGRERAYAGISSISSGPSRATGRSCPTPRPRSCPTSIRRAIPRPIRRRWPAAPAGTRSTSPARSGRTPGRPPLAASRSRRRRAADLVLDGDARGLCALPAARPSRLCRHGGRLLLPEQHRHRRPAPAAASISAWPCSMSTSITATARRASSSSATTC